LDTSGNLIEAALGGLAGNAGPKALGGGNDGLDLGAFLLSLVGLGGFDSSSAACFLGIAGPGKLGSGSSCIVNGSSGETFRVTEGVTGMIMPVGKVGNPPTPISLESVGGVLNPVIVSGAVPDTGVAFIKSWANLTCVGTLVSRIDPEVEVDMLESIELFAPVFLGLTDISAPGEHAHGDGSGFKGEMVDTASDTLAAIARGDERPVPRLREMDILLSEGNSDRLLILGDLARTCVINQLSYDRVKTPCEGPPLTSW
jgi:hypothetical protein